jgi:formimidoylglutamate deiminase
MYELVNQIDPQKFYSLSKQAFDEMLLSGITTVGEFHYFHHDFQNGAERNYNFDDIIIKAATDSGIRLVLLNTFYQRGGFGIPLSEAQKRFETKNVNEYLCNLDRLAQTLNPKIQSLGIVAHSVRAADIEDILLLYKYHNLPFLSVQIHIFLSFNRAARIRKLPFHMHLEEQQKEIEDCLKATKKSPLRLLIDSLESIGENSLENFTAVHLTQTSSELFHEFSAKRGNVVICPLTEGNLGDGVPMFLENVSEQTKKKNFPALSLGSDCNARIDFSEEMRWLEFSQRMKFSQRGMWVDLARSSRVADNLFHYATKGGARALGFPENSIGEICVGAKADFCALRFFSENSDDKKNILDTFIFGGLSVGNVGEKRNFIEISGVCVGGEWKEKKNISHPPFTSLLQQISSPSSLQPEISQKLPPVVSLAVELISISSLSGSEGPMATFLTDYLSSRDYHVINQRVGKTDRFNIFAAPKSSRDKHVTVLLNTHIDTVPPYFPASVDLVNQLIRGRGACDTKSIIAAQLCAAELLRKEGIDDFGAKKNFLRCNKIFRRVVVRRRGRSGPHWYESCQ